MTVLGVDLSPIQPKDVPANCSFRVQNVETEWNTDEQFDLIHCRAMILAFGDWLEYMKIAYKYARHIFLNKI
jgi:hypothetical protein